MTLLYHLLCWPLQLHVGGLVMSPGSSGWGVFDPEQAGEKTELRKPEISAAGQIITESLILITK